MATTRRTRSRRKRRPRAGTAGARPDAALSVFRVAVGAVAVGSEELVRRINAAAAAAHATRGRGPRRGRSTNVAESPAQSLGYAAVGLAAESINDVERIGRRIVRGGLDVLAAADAIASLPVIRTGARPARSAIARGRRTMRAVIARGRTETVEGRRLVIRLAEDTTASSVKDIAETAVKQVSHSPEVAALVRAQSTGVVTDTILEVRASSEQADDRLERRVRSWLHRGQRADSDGTEPARLAGDQHTG